MSKNIVPRSQIKKLKKMSVQDFREWMERFASSIWKSGYKEGLDNSESLKEIKQDVSDRVDATSVLIKALEKSKGIGPKRQEVILNNFKREWEESK